MPIYFLHTASICVIYKGQLKQFEQLGDIEDIGNGQYRIYSSYSDGGSTSVIYTLNKKNMTMQFVRVERDYHE